MRPLNAPAARGVNFTVNVMCAPGTSVMGKVIPLTLYVTLACKLSLLSATLVVPVFVMVTEIPFDVFTGTFPKFAAPGLKDNVPAPQAELASIAAMHASNAHPNAVRAKRCSAPSMIRFLAGAGPCGEIPDRP